MRVTGGQGIGGHHTQRVERTRFMKRKPILVAVAAFVVVLFGGVAMAGVGSFAGSGGGDDAAQIETLIEEPVVDNSVKAEPAETQPVKEQAKDEKPAKDEPKDEEPVKEEPKDEEPVRDKPKDEKPVEVVPKDLFSITNPADGSRVESKVVRFAGEAIEGVTVHRGKYKAEANGGEWAMELVLSPGKNKVAFEAVHISGKTEIEAVTVYYDAPIKEEPKVEKPKAEEPKEEKPKEEKPKEEEPKHIDFTAAQKYGSCGEEVPYDVFWGTTDPGATIKVKSAYGSGVTEANKKGHWEIKVKFPDSKPGDTFDVKVISSAGGSKVFTFTNTQGKEGDK